ncbi:MULTISPECIES: hypothetical protein [Xanthomonas]|uniref:hypothetical protein n=1 Tax=Xanthomonas TaxID=338 RepID=UPI0018E2ED76|nr:MULTISPECIES: hypothetical protein [Xanthomonas]
MSYHYHMLHLRKEHLAAGSLALTCMLGVGEAQLRHVSRARSHPHSVANMGGLFRASLNYSRHYQYQKPWHPRKKEQNKNIILRENFSARMNAKNFDD